MREIKFRAWDDDFKEMEYIGMSNIHDNSDIFLRAARSSYIPMQYTGLTDRHGKEIYEGDVIKGVGLVEFSDGRFWAGSTQNLDEINTSTEVIGNVYQNPGLLK